MKKPRRKFSASFKAKVVIEAIKDQKSLQELAAKWEGSFLKVVCKLK